MHHPTPCISNPPQSPFKKGGYQEDFRGHPYSFRYQKDDQRAIHESPLVY